MQSYLVQGDPLHPASGDLIAQTTSLAVGAPIPDGWRVLTGNVHHHVIARVAMRYEVERDEETEPAATGAAFPRLAAGSARYSYWELSPGRFQVFPHGVGPGTVAAADNGAGYSNLRALMRLKGD